MSDLVASDPRLDALRAYAEARHAYEAIRDQASEAKRAYDDMQTMLVETIMASGAKDTGKLPGVGEVILLAPALKCDVLAGDRLRLAEWVKQIEAEAGQKDSVIYPTLLPSALKEIVEKRIAENQPVPEFIKVYYEPRIQYRKGV